MDWSPASWRAFEARQQPFYPDPAALAAAERELAAYPALVAADDSARLRALLAEAQAGRAFLLQGGDCAESFADFSPATIASTHRLIAAMARRLAEASGLPVIRVGRIAGQFAKPRSAADEAREGHSLPAYRGDIVNSTAFDAAARRPDPDRMFRAYAQAAATIAHLDALASAGDGERVFTSHEALLLPFEQALVRPAENGRAHGGSAHFLWIGHRTLFEGSAHVEFARGLANPIGLKCGPGLEPDALLRLLDRLDPEGVPGRITLISRMGRGEIARLLPPLLRSVAASRRPVLWVCDPMHGNTVQVAGGYKTRPVEHILEEVGLFFALLAAEGLRAGGLHVEMTGRDVTECTGGEARLTEAQLGDRYHSQCDPRLNAGQAMELTELAARLLAPPPARAA
jgi:3-deoxy-7-phosphoheptulonate synthase